MNYPMESLVIIAPIVLLVLLIVVPVIGVFAGWKRSAYWGGGTFFFFIVGVIIWRTAGAKIVAFAKPLLTQALQSLSPSITITDKLLVSIAAPLFFLIVMMLAELILLINYYAWFKRVSGIKKDIQIKKAYKLAKKNKTKVKNQPKKGWAAMQVTTKGKVINMVCGGAGLTMLLAPSTITFSQAIFYTTTSVETRKNSKFASDLYASLQVWVAPFSWMSYYGNGDTAKDYNSLFSIVSLSTKETEYTYFDANGNEVTGKGNVTEAITNVISGGIQTIVKQTTEGGEDKATKVQKTEESITTLSTQWNPLVTSNQESVNSVFSSDSVTDIMKQVIGDQAKTKQTLTEDQIVNNYLSKDSVFETVYNDYVTTRPESEKLVQIPVTQETFNNVVDSIKEVIIIADGTSQTVIDQFNEKLNDVAQLMFKVV